MAGDDLRELGFVAAHHQLWSSPDLTGFRASHLFVFVTVIHLANWKPDHFWVGKHRVEVGRGELAHSLASIAKEARATIREVRTTVDNLLKRHVLRSRSVSAGDTVVRVLTVANYERFQSLRKASDTGSDTPPAQEATSHRQATDKPPTLREPREPDQPGEPERETRAPGRPRPLDVLGEARAAEYPALAATLAALDAAGVPLSWSKRADVNQPMEADAAKLGPERAAAAIREAYARDPNSSLGWFKNDLHRAANGGGQGAQQPKQVTAAASPPSAFVGGVREL